MVTEFIKDIRIPELSVPDISEYVPDKAAIKRAAFIGILTAKGVDQTIVDFFRENMSYTDTLVGAIEKDPTISDALISLAEGASGGSGIDPKELIAQMSGENGAAFIKFIHAIGEAPEWDGSHVNGLIGHLRHKRYDRAVALMEEVGIDVPSDLSTGASIASIASFFEDMAQQDGLLGGIFRWIAHFVGSYLLDPNSAIGGFLKETFNVDAAETAEFFHKNASLRVTAADAAATTSGLSRSEFFAGLESALKGQTVPFASPDEIMTLFVTIDHRLRDEGRGLDRARNIKDRFAALSSMSRENAVSAMADIYERLSLGQSMQAATAALRRSRSAPQNDTHIR